MLRALSSFLTRRAELPPAAKELAQAVVERRIAPGTPWVQASKEAAAPMAMSMDFTAASTALARGQQEARVVVGLMQGALQNGSRTPTQVAQLEARAGHTLRSLENHLATVSQRAYEGARPEELRGLMAQLEDLKGAVLELRDVSHTLQTPANARLLKPDKSLDFDQKLVAAVKLAKKLEPGEAGYFVHNNAQYPVVPAHVKPLALQSQELLALLNSDGAPSLSNTFTESRARLGKVQHALVDALVSSTTKFEQPRPLTSLRRMAREDPFPTNPSVGREMARSLAADDPSHVVEVRWASSQVWHRSEAVTLVKHWLSTLPEREVRALVSAYDMYPQAKVLWHALTQVTGR